jgi:hypothetical protein
MVDKELKKLALDNPLRCLIAYQTMEEVEKDLEETLDGLEAENNHLVHRTLEAVFSAHIGPD